MIIVTDKKGDGETSSGYIPISDGIKNTSYYQEKYNEYYATYMGQSYETEEERAARIVRETEDDLSGCGYGDY